MNQLMTTIGQGSTIVQCNYSVDADGDIDDLEVMFEGVDIISALSGESVEYIEEKCQADYGKASAELRDQAAISKDDARRDDVACGVQV